MMDTAHKQLAIKEKLPVDETPVDTRQPIESHASQLTGPTTPSFQVRAIYASEDIVPWNALFRLLDGLDA